MKNEPWVLMVAGRWVDYTASGDEIRPLMLMTEVEERLVACLWVINMYWVLMSRAVCVWKATFVSLYKSWGSALGHGTNISVDSAYLACQ